MACRAASIRNIFPSVAALRGLLEVFLVAWSALFSRKSASVLGLDISSSSIKLVELSQKKSGEWVLARCAIETLERSWVTDGNIEKFEEVTEAVRRVVKKSGTRANQVVIALPPSAVITKRITLPDGLTESELEAQVESEASQYIPFALEEVRLDFCVIGPSHTVDNELDILIAAARKEKVQDRQGLAEAAGLKPVAVDIESYASRLVINRLMENLPRRGAAELVALFEIGAFTTSMQVMAGEEVLYDREQAFGGAQLTQIIMRQYGFSIEEAESKKRNGELPDDYATLLLQPFVAGMAQELMRVLQFFFASTSYNKVDHIFLAGGSASLPGLTESVTAQTGFPCQVVDPFEGMTIGSQIRSQRLAREAPSYITACGLAMRGFVS